METIVIDVVGEWGTGKSAFLSKLGGIDTESYVPTIVPNRTTLILQTTIGEIKFVLIEYGGRNRYDRDSSGSDGTFIFVDNSSSLLTLDAYIPKNKKPTVVCMHKYDSFKRNQLFNDWLEDEHNAHYVAVKTSIVIKDSLYTPFNALLQQLYDKDVHII